MWYKWNGTEILEAPSLDLPGGIHLDDTAQDQSPVQGWHWFANATDAQVLNPQPLVVSIDLMKVTRDAEAAALDAYRDVIVGGTLSMGRLRDAQLAAMSAKIAWMEINGGLE